MLDPATCWKWVKCVTLEIQYALHSALHVFQHTTGKGSGGKKLLQVAVEVKKRWQNAGPRLHIGSTLVKTVNGSRRDAVSSKRVHSLAINESIPVHKQAQ